MAGEFLHAVVEFMVAEDLNVVFHHVHQRKFHIAAEELEIECTLHDISCIYEKHVFLSLAHRVDDGLALQHSSGSRGVGVDKGMSVVGVKNHEIVGQRACACERRYGKSGHEPFNFHRISIL